MEEYKINFVLCFFFIFQHKSQNDTNYLHPGLNWDSKLIDEENL